MAEEYFKLGINLKQTGKFWPEVDAPFVFRPPGYIIFIAGVLIARNAFQSKEHKQEIDTKIGVPLSAAVVHFFQCLLLSISAGILFFWLSLHLRWINAFMAAILFGVNPYMVILTGLFHYEVLHIFFVILSCWLLSMALRDEKLSVFQFSAAGIFWGLTPCLDKTNNAHSAFFYNVNGRNSLQIFPKAGIQGNGSFYLWHGFGDFALHHAKLYADQLIYPR